MYTNSQFELQTAFIYEEVINRMKFVNPNYDSVLRKRFQLTF